jgi:beta-N-acetylhexosaminidase
MPVDSRELATIIADDMQPFIALQSRLEAIMPAHILFPAVDKKAVGFSEYWLQSILRTQLQFKGVIFSDDLNMDGAGFAGDYSARAQAALSAGCDMILICNNRTAALAILDFLSKQSHTLAAEKFKTLRGKFTQNTNQLRSSPEWLEKQELLNRIPICSPTPQ